MLKSTKLILQSERVPWMRSYHDNTEAIVWLLGYAESEKHGGIRFVILLPQG